MRTLLSTIHWQFDELFLYARWEGIPLYVLIDEYDNFANTILAGEGAEAWSREPVPVYARHLVGRERGEPRLDSRHRPSRAACPGPFSAVMLDDGWVHGDEAVCDQIADHPNRPEADR